MAITSAHVDLAYLDSGDLFDAFQFGTAGDTSWSFSAKTFLMDIKGDTDDVAPLLSLTTANSAIVVDDAALRVLHLYVAKSALEAALVPGCYVYDLVMVDGVTTVRTPLMAGKLEIKHGATQE